MIARPGTVFYRFPVAFDHGDGIGISQRQTAAIGVTAANSASIIAFGDELSIQVIMVDSRAFWSDLAGTPAENMPCGSSLTARYALLPRAKQKFVIEMIDTVIQQAS